MEPLCGVTLGIKSQKELESDEAELRRPIAALLHLSPPYFISLKKITQLFDCNSTIYHAPGMARSSASLRSSPLSVGLRCVAVAPGSIFLFLHTQGCAALRLALGYYAFAPLHGALNSARLRSQTVHETPIYRVVLIAVSTVNLNIAYRKNTRTAGRNGCFEKGRG